jgi:hypothetical protein
MPGSGAGQVSPGGGPGRKRRSRRLLDMTNTELNAMAGIRSPKAAPPRYDG